MSKKPSYQELLYSQEKLKLKIRSLEKKLKDINQGSVPPHDVSDESYSAELFYKAFHSNPALMAISDFHDAVYMDVNEAFLTNLGYNRKEIIGHTSTELQLYVDLIQSDQFLSDLQKGRKVQDFEVRIKTKSGDTRIGMFSAETIILDGEPCLLTIINDITERKKAEAVLRQAESRYKLMFENMSNCVAIYQAIEDGNDFKILGFNAAAEKVEKLKSEKT